MRRGARDASTEETYLILVAMVVIALVVLAMIVVIVLVVLAVTTQRARGGSLGVVAGQRTSLWPSERVMRGFYTQPAVCHVHRGRGSEREMEREMREGEG